MGRRRTADIAELCRFKSKIKNYVTNHFTRFDIVVGGGAHIGRRTRPRRRQGRRRAHGRIPVGVARPSRRRAGQPYGYGRRPPSGRYALRRGDRRGGNLLARARIPRRRRCGRTCRQFGGRKDGHSDLVALRRRFGTPLGRYHEQVRRAGGRHAGCGTAFLYLLYNDAAHDGRLRRPRPRRYRARPSQPQRDVRRRPRARHDLPERCWPPTHSRGPWHDSRRACPHGRGRGMAQERRHCASEGGAMSGLYPPDPLPPSGGSLAKSPEHAQHLSLPVDMLLRGHSREPRSRHRQAV